jgi:MEDS: MEthanogen/methylotroph, DcmR Sensory domain
MHFATSTQPELSLGFGHHTCNWGAHMCALYESDQERDELMCGVLHEGDLEGSLDVVSHAPPSPERFLTAYARRFPGEQDHPRDAARFTIWAADQFYCPQGRFELDTMTRRWNALTERSAHERRTVRLVAEMDWALGDVPGRDLLIPYEALLDDYLAGKPFLTVCAYDLRRFSGATVMGVLRTHRYTISRGMVVENPYFDPKGWLAQHAPDTRPLGS